MYPLAIVATNNAKSIQPSLKFTYFIFANFLFDHVSVSESTTCDYNLLTIFLFRLPDHQTNRPISSKRERSAIGMQYWYSTISSLISEASRVLLYQGNSIGRDLSSKTQHLTTGPIHPPLSTRVVARLKHNTTWSVTIVMKIHKTLLDPN